MTALRTAAPGLDLARHLRAAGSAALYLILGLAWGLLYLLLGVLLVIAWIVRPLLRGALGVARQLAGRERRYANRLLDAHLPPVARGGRGPVAMLLLRLPVTLLALVPAAAPILLAAALLILGIDGLGGDGELFVGPWALGPALGIALCLLALPAAVVSVAVLDGVGRLLRGLARRLLRSDADGAGPVRELLAERLGDRSLNVAYWLPDRERFVDERGRPVELPAAGSGRAWTAVEHEGRRVAAIVHDAELDASPQLVHAAAAAAALALDNERLKADLRARVEELRVSRRRIVQAADDARRRIERDLHDGAQQQLVSLALDLRMLRARLDDEAEGEAVDEIAAKLARALAELRELARGIHPAILADHGLAPAIHALVDRAPVHVDCSIAIEDRLPPAVEAAAYFVVAEALTNVVKYANAKEVALGVRRDRGELEVIVQDDGVGGARLDVGSGLRGLSDRVAALEGRLTVESPLGGGTRVHARIPTRPPGER